MKRKGIYSVKLLEYQECDRFEPPVQGKIAQLTMRTGNQSTSKLSFLLKVMRFTWVVDYHQKTLFTIIKYLKSHEFVSDSNLYCDNDNGGR